MKALTKSQERAKRQAEWDAEQARVEALGNLFSALPDCTARHALMAAMIDRIWALYNECRLEEGDAILEFLPNDEARKLLDDYFSDEPS